MLEKGYGKLRIGDIQSRLGISRGLMYRYFKGKSDLVFFACREYFYDRYFKDVDYDSITLADFFRHADAAVRRITDFEGEEVEMLKYNTLYSSLIQSNPQFKSVALSEFRKALKVIKNSIKRGEVKNLPENFIGATILAILGRTSYITETPSNGYVVNRMLSDVKQFYGLIKK